jgi:hypothetical protein
LIEEVSLVEVDFAREVLDAFKRFGTGTADDPVDLVAMLE